MVFDTGFLNYNLIVQGLIAAIIIGMFYTLWTSTKTYGGIIGRALRLLGLGIMFISVAVIEKMLVNFQVITMTPNVSLAQDVFNLAGLTLLAWGFRKLSSVSRT